MHASIRYNPRPRSPLRATLHRPVSRTTIVISSPSTAASMSTDPSPGAYACSIEFAHASELARMMSSASGCGTSWPESQRPRLRRTEADSEEEGRGRHPRRADRKVDGEGGERHARPEAPAAEEEADQRDPRGGPERRDVLADEGESKAELGRQVVSDPKSDRHDHVGSPFPEAGALAHPVPSPSAPGGLQAYLQR
jgi:hypothetical protein